MKRYEDLSQIGKLRRIKQIAYVAIKEFGFTNASIRLQGKSGNIIYRLKADGRNTDKKALYSDGLYSLRLHQPDYQNDNAINSELLWLKSMSDAGLPVPEPIPTIKGGFSVDISVPGVPLSRRCSLLRWVKGRMAPKLVLPWHMKAIGRLIGKLQTYSSTWKPPPSFVRRHYDSDGLWGNDTGTGYSKEKVWSKIPQRYYKEFQQVTTRVEQVMDVWGKGSDVYGLIHADLGTVANVLFYEGEARAIDFDDSGYGYWVYDLAVPLVDLFGMESYTTLRDALLEGYLECRSLPEEQLAMLDVFQAAFRALEIFWGAAVTLSNPDNVYWKERMEEAWTHIKHILRAGSI